MAKLYYTLTCAVFSIREYQSNTAETYWVGIEDLENWFGISNWLALRYTL